jgi:hypothetical protein
MPINFPTDKLTNGDVFLPPGIPGAKYVYNDAKKAWIGTGGTGYTGSTGLPGEPGSPGFVGSTGFVGSVGFVGSQGIIGYTGSIGAGYTGSAGVGSSYTLPVATTTTLGGVKLGAGLATDASGNLILASLNAVSASDAPYALGVYNNFAKLDNSLWQPGTDAAGSTIGPIGAFIPGGAPGSAPPTSINSPPRTGSAVPPWTGNFLRFDSNAVPGTWRCITTIGAGGSYVTTTAIGNTTAHYQVVLATRIA